ncbi:MAG: hypothetical protein K8I02_12175 [Candidatus Methylomirabilis sp.]|nr:hypothetical protein [Deltaproteobacteria bacterium]
MFLAPTPRKCRRNHRFSAGATFDSLGRYLAFESGATNLETGDTNMRTDVFVGPNPP